MQTIKTRFQAVQNEKITNRYKSVASQLIDMYKWNDNQMWFLEQQATKGYIVTHLNAAREAFGQSLFTDGDRVGLMTIDFGLCSKRKRDLQVFAL